MKAPVLVCNYIYYASVRLILVHLLVKKVLLIKKDLRSHILKCHDFDKSTDVMKSIRHPDLLFTVWPYQQYDSYLYASSDIDQILLIPFSKSDGPF